MLTERLNSLMQENQIKNLYQLAEKTKIPYTTFRNWYAGKAKPNIETLLVLANFFECSIDYLIGRSDDFGNIQRPEQKEELTPGERELLEKYRGLSTAGKQQAAALIDSVATYEKQTVKSGVKIG